MMWFRDKDTSTEDLLNLQILNLRKELADLRAAHTKCERPKDWGITMITYHKTLTQQTVLDDGMWRVGSEFVSIPKRDGGIIHIDKTHILSIERTPAK